MDDALKENRIRTSKRRKLKKRVVRENEAQTNIILDHEENEATKDIDDDVAIGVLMQRGKVLSQPTTVNEGRGKENSLTRKSSKRKAFAVSKRKQWEVLAEEEHYVATWAPKPKQAEASQGLLAQSDAEIIRLKAAPIEKSGLVDTLHRENDALKAEVRVLTQKLLKAHETANERMSVLLQKLSGP
ncbi:hypothetical protein HAX54_016214 [Datura stramonium]|uniref:Uncharacterized protein n=1 Tax=Datura stramonium TaxID=4076 RepID=A0ABS8UKR6_DATST|nr:hypothetical protein [Datura stramonium]